MAHSSTIKPLFQFKNQGHWGHLYKNYLRPFHGIRVFPSWWKFLWRGHILYQIEGEEGSLAERLADCIEQTPETYPYKEWYALLGPNSNTYVQWILDQFPEVKFSLPWNAFGKNFSNSK